MIEASRTGYWFMITSLATLLIGCLTWYVGIYPELVLKKDLEVLAPYTRDRGQISDFIARATLNMAKLSDNLEKVDTKLTTEIRSVKEVHRKELHKLELQIERLHLLGLRAKSGKGG